MSAVFAAFAPSAVKLAIESSRHCTASAQTAPSCPYGRYSSGNVTWLKFVNAVPHAAFAFEIAPYFVEHQIRNACSDCGS